MKALKSLGIAVAVMLAVVGSAQTMTAQERQVAEDIVKAIKVYKDGDIEGSKRSFIDIYDKNPNSTDVMSWLGFLYLRTNEPAKAIPVLEKVMAAKPGDLEVKNNLATAYLSTDQADKAFDMYKAIAEQEPRTFQAWYNMGNIYLKRGDYAAAAKAYSRASELKLDDQYVYNNLGVANESLGNVESAAMYFGKASNLEPSNKTFARNAGYSYVRLKEYAKAEPFLARAWSLDNSDYKVGVALASTYAQTNRPSEALRVYQDLESTAGAKSTDFWYNVGVLRSKTDVRAGEDAYRRALEIDPNDIDSLQNLGLSLYRRGAYGEAAVMFERWAGTDANSLEAKVNLAAATAKTGNVPKSMALWKQILDMDPSRTGIRLSLANALWQKKEREAARAHWEMVLRQDPKCHEAHNGMGLYHLLEKSNLLEAESEFRASIANNGKFVPAYNNLAVTLEKLKRRKEAIGVLERAKKISPNTAEIGVNLQRMKAEEKKTG